MTEKLRPFQRQFVKAVESPAYDTVALSGPRGLGKTFLAGYVLARGMTPGDKLHQPGKEYILGAASLEQARMTYAFIRAELEPRGRYRWIDSTTRLGATHVASNTKLRAISSNAKTSFGLVNVPLVVIDEPGVLEIVGGQMLADSLFTAQGKPGSDLKVIVIGTLVPMATASGHWWYDLVTEGTAGETHVQLFQGDVSTWDEWATIRRANPLTAIGPSFRAKLLSERDKARGDSRLKARFLSYRLNVPSADESQTLLTVDDWAMLTSREVPEREGAPTVGVDLGGGTAFSAAVGIWPNGRCEAMAVAPGIPSIEDQERRDRTPKGSYQTLLDVGALEVGEGLRVQPPAQLVEAITRKWGIPRVIVCDRFQLADLQDSARGIRLEPRVTQWSDSSSDIRALRKITRDGPLAVASESCSHRRPTSWSFVQTYDKDVGSVSRATLLRTSTGRVTSGNRRFWGVSQETRCARSPVEPLKLLQRYLSACRSRNASSGCQGERLAFVCGRSGGRIC